MNNDFYGRPQCASAQTQLWDSFCLFLLLHGTIYMCMCEFVCVCCVCMGVYYVCVCVYNIYVLYYKYFACCFFLKFVTSFIVLHFDFCF